ncbi:MAG: proton-conducting membrane transporter [Actinomycetota bacterium]|nr:proton-conducting membrane transporter [Actinomycetota bacterium]
MTPKDTAGPEMEPGALGAGRLPRLLAGLDKGGRPMPLTTHRRRYAAPRPGRPNRELLAVVDRSGLRGRGGAGFPTARKLAAVSERRRPIVVVNGCEGEPASGKDKVLLQLAPHLVLDGALLAAAAVGSDEVIVCVDRYAAAAMHSLHQALGERQGERGAAVRIEAIPHRYVAGDESALVHWLNGGPAKPTLTPPRPSVSGVARRPTLVDNVETLAHLAQIAHFGADWFRQLGTPSIPGSTLSGAVLRPGVCEVAVGTPLDEVVAVGGTGPAGIGAVLVGGYYGSWLSPAQVGETRLCDDDLRPIGGGVGCGAVVVLPINACGLHETARILSWLAGETAGQCGPCVNGLAAIAGAMVELHDGHDTVARLRHWAGQIEGRGACRFPDGAVRLLRSALTVFTDDIERHLHGAGCPSRPGTVAVPDVVREPWR